MKSNVSLKRMSFMDEPSITSNSPSSASHSPLRLSQVVQRNGGGILQSHGHRDADSVTHGGAGNKGRKYKNKFADLHGI
jgi:hypothetical protein